MDYTREYPDPFRRLTAIMAKLRAEDGCPWDREQTHESLKKYMLEEAHEACEAIDRGEDEELCAELGDVALQVAFHARIAEEEGRFDIDDVMTSICDKLIRRHPHVFGEEQADTPEEVLKNWEKIKREEKGEEKDAPRSALDGVPRSLPALHRAQRMQDKAARIGFDWPSSSEALPKLNEEMRELAESVEQQDEEGVVEELGDLMFAIVNYARLRRLHAEESLHAAIEKFETRFRAMENRIRDNGGDPARLSLEELDAVWDAVKRDER